MCYSTEHAGDTKALYHGKWDEEDLSDFEISLYEEDDLDFYFYANGFEDHFLTIFKQQYGTKPLKARWGLLPKYLRHEKYEQQKFFMLNKRVESLQKPIWSHLLHEQRCLVPATAFFEWRHYQKKKYPYRISRQDGKPFFLAGIWEEWLNQETGELVPSYAILTQEANPLMEQVHNSKKRMPIIIPHGEEEKYLCADSINDVHAVLKNAATATTLKAQVIGKLISQRGQNKNVPEIRDLASYPELPPLIRSSPPPPELNHRAQK